MVSLYLGWLGEELGEKRYWGIAPPPRPPSWKKGEFASDRGIALNSYIDGGESSIRTF